MPYGVPRGFFLQNIVYAYFLVFEKEKSRSPKVSVLVDSTVETVGGAASLWFGF